MVLKTSGSTITIEGNIKTQQDFIAIKNSVESMGEAKAIHFNLIDTMSMTSSVIGFLTKTILKDKIAISMSINDERLYGLLSDLNLVQTFNVKRK
ncbi:MAG: hypothetical protein RBR59_04030 [Sulfurimonadaceae bacterium]|jgi:hypothetical protein|nr:hypothetical protein [Sulfurimonadaceae bacterium]